VFGSVREDVNGRSEQSLSVLFVYRRGGDVSQETKKLENFLF